MGPGVFAVSNTNVYQKIFLRNKARPTRKADKPQRHLGVDGVGNAGSSTSQTLQTSTAFTGIDILFVVEPCIRQIHSGLENVDRYT
jgi:hypothetical protein